MDKALQLLNIKHNEKLLVALMLGFSCSVGLAVSFLKTIADASFIIQFGIVKVPEAIILGGVVGYVANSLLTILYKKWGFGNVTTLLSVATSMIITLFCLMLIFGKSTVSPTYWLFIVSMPMSLIIENAFNGTILRYLNYEQNKRLSGLLISGAVFSGIIGCFLIPFLKSILPKIEYLLLFSAIGCILCLLLFVLIRLKISVAESSKETTSLKQKKISLPLKSSYFWQMTAFILIAAGLFYVINFGFLYLLGDIKKNYSVDMVIVLIAFVNGAIKLSEFVLSLISGKILAKRGVAFGLIAMPVCLLTFIALAFVFTEAHQFWIFFGCIVMTKFVERVVRKGLLRPSLNVLYQLFDEKKSKVQHFLDGNVASVSAILFGGALYVLVKLVHDDLTIPFSFVTSIITGVWVLISIAISIQYRKELYKKLSSIPVKTSPHLIDLVYHSKFDLGAIPVSGSMHNQLTRPLLLLDNLALDAEIPKPKNSLEVLINPINYAKLNYLLITHYRLEKNPFYSSMSIYFIKEIEDEIDNIGKQLGTKYKHSKLRETIRVLYNSPSADEQLYAYELLTATANKKDKKQIQIIYNLITSSILEKSFLYSFETGNKGLRKIMKSIISEEQFSFSPVLKACAINMLGQNYVLKVPKEIQEALNSDEILVREMAEAILEYDKNDGNGLILTGENWLLLNEIRKCKALMNLGNQSLNRLLRNAKSVNSIALNKHEVFLIVDQWTRFDFVGNVNLIGMSDDSILQTEIQSIETAKNAKILSWNSMHFLELIEN